MQKDFGHRINFSIRISPIRVYKDGECLGIMSTDQARQIALDEGLDLVEMAATAKPPVCHIMDYGKFKYEQKIKDKEKVRKQREQSVLLKGIRLTPSIEIHDLETKIKQAKDFLKEGKKVQLNMKFSFRELQTSKEIGLSNINHFVESLKEFSQVEFGPKFEGNKLIVRLTNLD